MYTEKIPLFDIDWTLLEGGNKTHRQGFDVAFKEVYGLPDASIDEIKTDGMIDKQIIIEVLKLHHLEDAEIKAKIDVAVAVIERHYLEHATAGECIPMPGVVELLTQLQAQGVPMGLLTGNIEGIGWKKVERAGLRQFFSFGAFGNLAYRRPDLIGIALERANMTHQAEFQRNQLVIIGDAPLDVACAKAGGIEVVAIGAGNFTADELRAVGADLALPSMTDAAAIINFLAR